MLSGLLRQLPSFGSSQQNVWFLVAQVRRLQVPLMFAIQNYLVPFPTKKSLSYPKQR